MKCALVSVGVVCCGLCPGASKAEASKRPDGLNGSRSRHSSGRKDAHDWSTSSSGLTAKQQQRQGKLLKRQSHVEDPLEPPRRQASTPALRPPAAQTLRKHDSYPQYSHKRWRARRLHEQAVGAVVIRAVEVDPLAIEPEPANPARASHTPAVRAGPPLSCNFCWNTVDESGRILRRKTQYHCPECRANLCIVPCFHEYHDGPAVPPPVTAT